MKVWRSARAAGAAGAARAAGATDRTRWARRAALASIAFAAATAQEAHAARIPTEAGVPGVLACGKPAPLALQDGGADPACDPPALGATDVRTGPRVDGGSRRPERGAARACSFRLPICVQGDGAPHASILAGLASAERAWDVVTGSLDLPAPDADLATGAYDIYLVDLPPGAPRASTTAGSPDGRTRIDRASAFTLLDRATTPGCAMDALLFREVARASLFRAAPATDAGSALAETSYLARLGVPCALGLVDGVDVFQAHPGRALVDTWEEARGDDVRSDAAPGDLGGDGPAYDRGAALFFWWLDASFGAEPGAIVRALWSLSATMTPPIAHAQRRWVDEPDGFDVLATSFKSALTTGSTADDLFLQFAAARALLGPADDGTVLPEARLLGAALRPRLDWDIDWPATPRRLASSAGVAPTGAAYVAVRHAGAERGARLRLEAAWEEHAKMRWLVLKRDAEGRELGRVLVPVVERATEAQATVVDLDGVDSVLVVGMNAGDPFQPFDPDERVWEPHGWTLTLAAE